MRRRSRFAVSLLTLAIATTTAATVGAAPSPSPSKPAPPVAAPVKPVPPAPPAAIVVGKPGKVPTSAALLKAMFAAPLDAQKCADANGEHVVVGAAFTEGWHAITSGPKDDKTKQIKRAFCQAPKKWNAKKNGKWHGKADPVAAFVCSVEVYEDLSKCKDCGEDFAQYQLDFAVDAQGAVLPASLSCFCDHNVCEVDPTWGK